MNRRPTLLAAIALTAVAALSLSACGSDDSSKKKDNDKIAGADTGDEKSPSPSESAADSAQRPKIELPSDVTHIFTPEQSDDTVKNAVLKDNAELIRALDAAIVAQNPRLPALEFYTEGEGAVAAQKWVKAFADAGWTITGKTRYFDRQVTVSSKNTASLSYCADESKAFSKVIKTDEIKKTEVTKNSYVAYGAQVEKNDEGVWELMKISSTRGADRCQP
ncbi:hypothetical protein FE633_28455 [Streptomyces montanus]|uniref:Lipoprotein n=1 Tax=Streptomyces montanus TaxID=2580423 RepID=A0A5R9FLT5_9ACTN|nr:hypothetical protein [Streptomyces montanus]TLS42930.1 hypothetical protein FE633_28455 [Streptomyces montanus]